MDDFNLPTLKECRNEWSIKLITILTPFILQGIQSIYTEASNICASTGEPKKELKTFQNLLLRVSKWNNSIVEKETNRIIKESHCPYLEDILTAVHVVYLKILSAIRVGQIQKKIDLNIPKVSVFIHQAYIKVAYIMYKNAYLFQKKDSIQQLKDNRTAELMIQECILNAIRDNIPTNTILRAYLDETMVETAQMQQSSVPDDTPVASAEPDIVLVKPEPVPQPDIVTLQQPDMVEPDIVTVQQPVPVPEPVTLTFNDVDSAISVDGNLSSVDAPKDPERLDNISLVNHLKRKEEDLASASSDLLTIGDDVDEPLVLEVIE